MHRPRKRLRNNSRGKHRKIRYARRMNLEEARRIPLDQLLAQLGHEPVRRSGDTIWYKSPLRDEGDASFNVSRRKNLWYDFGSGEGGSCIDLIMRVEKLTKIGDCLAELERIMGGLRLTPIVDEVSSPAFAESPSSGIEISKELPITAKALWSYLQSRSISRDAALSCLQQVHYRIRGHEYFALGFQNDKGGFEIRNKQFKGSTSKDISTTLGDTHRVFCFEGFFDYLTALTMFDGKLDGTAIVLNSAGLKQKAIDQIKRLRPSVVELYFDDDAAGHSLVEEFRKSLPECTVVDWHDLYKGHGDLNAWYCDQITQRRRVGRA